MKKIMVSLAAVAALTTGAMAADKGIDIVTTGQAVLYYQTIDKDVADDKGFFDSSNSRANVGLQLNLNADLKNNFTFGSQLSYLGTAGLENNLVDSVMQQNNSSLINSDSSNDIMLTKIFVAKKIGNTTVKIGRQELPKSLSPLAFSEGWNVFKNTFDAILAVNTDLPNTTLVGAYVSKSNKNGFAADISDFSDLTVDGSPVGKGTYLLTAQTTAIPMTTFTASYYTLHNVGDHSPLGSGANTPSISADAYWLDAKIADKSLPMGLSLGIQYGNVDPDTLEDTTAYGVKIGAKPMPALTLCAAYTDVDDGSVSVSNVGTGVKTPLYTQMIANQNAIKLDSETYMVKAAYSLGDMGTVIAQYADTDAGKVNRNGDNNDYNEFDFVYKLKAGGVDYLAAYVMTDYDKDSALSSTHDTDIIRFWARYNF